MTSPLARAQASLGSRAIVEKTETASEDGFAVVWRVGVKGSDDYSWSVLGQSTRSFAHALHLAVKHQTGRR